MRAPRTTAGVIAALLLVGIRLGRAFLAEAAIPAQTPDEAVTAATGTAPRSGWDDASSHGPIPVKAVVVSVYDGDTFTLETGDKIRLRWVNTPEMKPEEPWARDAKAFTDRFVRGQEVDLQVGSEGRDSYGRILAGVTTSEGSLSLALLEEGLGHLFLIPPDEIDLAPLYAAEERARAAGRGIWSHERFAGPLHITSFHGNGRGDDATNPNAESIRVCNISGKPLDLSQFRVRNEAGQVFPLGRMNVPPGYTVKIQSGRGTNQTDATRQQVTYLNQTTGIWNDEGDTVELLDASGRVVDWSKH